ncbi:MAG TPA: TIGR03118 family protein [Isosphaeraceae bacterium]|jgi:uncharacterized protein (TIGR03118 family)|nr:TIGR03118 family protein [Isosphaeraceae bacterium]
MRLALRRAALAGLALAAASPATCRADFYQQTNLVSDVSGLAAVTDPNLKNPWGMSAGPGSPLWVSDQGTGVATLYTGAGQPFPPPPNGPLVVTIPPPAGSAANGNPTGQVFNGNANDFNLTTGGHAVFLFASLNGTITGWNGASGTNAQLAVTTPGAVYTGLAIGDSSQGTVLYAADARNNRIDVFDSTFHPTHFAAGAFTDPTVAAGYNVYGVHRIGDTVYVTYAHAGGFANTLGGGFVDAYSADGVLKMHVGLGGNFNPFNAPWGVALAPSGFGQFGGDLLVGNFLDGHINAFDPTTGAFLGQLTEQNGVPFTEPGLWALKFGQGGLGGDPNTLFFTAGIGGEAHGLLGEIKAVPEPASFALLGLGAAFVASRRRRRS